MIESSSNVVEINPNLTDNTVFIGGGIRLIYPGFFTYVFVELGGSVASQI
jgi:hypothetical protein